MKGIKAERRAERKCRSLRVVIAGGPIAGPRSVQSLLVGDCNGDGKVDSTVTDAIVLVAFNFLGTQEPPCLAACDVDADGNVRGIVADALYLLTFLFSGGPAPLPPFPACGAGTEADLVTGCHDATPGCESR